MPYATKTELVEAIRGLNLPEEFAFDWPLLVLGIPELSIIGWHRSVVIDAMWDPNALHYGRPVYQLDKGLRTYRLRPMPVVPSMLTNCADREDPVCRDCGRRTYCGGVDNLPPVQCGICERRERISILIGEEDRLFGARGG